MGQKQPSGMDHPAFHCMTQLYLADKKNRALDLCRKEDLTLAQLNEILQYLLPKCTDPDMNLYRSNTVTLTVPHNRQHLQVSIATANEPAPTPLRTGPTTVYPDSLLIRHRDDLLRLVQQTRELQILMDALDRDYDYERALVLRSKVLEYCQLIQHLELVAGKEGPNEIPALPELTEDHRPNPKTEVERDMMFLHHQFEAAVGRCVLDTLTGLETIEQYEERKKTWKTVQDIMAEACEAGRRREPPVPDNILRYYRSA